MMGNASTAATNCRLLMVDTSEMGIFVLLALQTVPYVSLHQPASSAPMAISSKTEPVSQSATLHSTKTWIPAINVL